MTANGPWLVLIHDPSPDDPKFILATITQLSHIRPARPEPAVDDVTAAWVASSSGLRNPVLTALPGARCWRIDEPR